MTFCLIKFVLYYTAYGTETRTETAVAWQICHIISDLTFIDAIFPCIYPVLYVAVYPTSMDRYPPPLHNVHAIHAYLDQNLLHPFIGHSQWTSMDLFCPFIGHSPIILPLFTCLSFICHNRLYLNNVALNIPKYCIVMLHNLH